MPPKPKAPKPKAMGPAAVDEIDPALLLPTPEMEIERLEAEKAKLDKKYHQAKRDAHARDEYASLQVKRVIAHEFIAAEELNIEERKLEDVLELRAHENAMAAKRLHSSQQRAAFNAGTAEMVETYNAERFHTWQLLNEEKLHREEDWGMMQHELGNLRDRLDVKMREGLEAFREQYKAEAERAVGDEARQAIERRYEFELRAQKEHSWAAKWQERYDRLKLQTEDERRMNDYHAAAEREQAQRMMQLKRKVTRLKSAESKAEDLQKRLSASQHDVRSLQAELADAHRQLEHAHTKAARERHEASRERLLLMRPRMSGPGGVTAGMLLERRSEAIEALASGLSPPPQHPPSPPPPPPLQLPYDGDRLQEELERREEEMAREETALDAMWRSGHDGNYASASDFGVRAPSHAPSSGSASHAIMPAAANEPRLMKMSPAAAQNSSMAALYHCSQPAVDERPRSPLHGGTVLSPQQRRTPSPSGSVHSAGAASHHSAASAAGDVGGGGANRGGMCSPWEDTTSAGNEFEWSMMHTYEPPPPPPPPPRSPHASQQPLMQPPPSPSTNTNPFITQACGSGSEASLAPAAVTVMVPPHPRAASPATAPPPPQPPPQPPRSPAYAQPLPTSASSSVLVVAGHAPSACRPLAMTSGATASAPALPLARPSSSGQGSHQQQRKVNLGHSSSGKVAIQQQQHTMQRPSSAFTRRTPQPQQQKQ